MLSLLLPVFASLAAAQFDLCSVGSGFGGAAACSFCLATTIGGSACSFCSGGPLNNRCVNATTVCAPGVRVINSTNCPTVATSTASTPSFTTPVATPTCASFSDCESCTTAGCLFCGDGFGTGVCTTTGAAGSCPVPIVSPKACATATASVCDQMSCSQCVPSAGCSFCLSDFASVCMPAGRAASSCAAIGGVLATNTSSCPAPCAPAPAPGLCKLPANYEIVNAPITPCGIVNAQRQLNLTTPANQTAACNAATAEEGTACFQVLMDLQCTLACPSCSASSAPLLTKVCEPTCSQMLAKCNKTLAACSEPSDNSTDSTASYFCASANETCVNVLIRADLSVLTYVNGSPFTTTNSNATTTPTPTNNANSTTVATTVNANSTTVATTVNANSTTVATTVNANSTTVATTVNANATTVVNSNSTLATTVNSNSTLATTANANSTLATTSGDSNSTSSNVSATSTDVNATPTSGVADATTIVMAAASPSALVSSTLALAALLVLLGVDAN